MRRDEDGRRSSNRRPQVALGRFADNVFSPISIIKGRDVTRPHGARSAGANTRAYFRNTKIRSIINVSFASGNNRDYGTRRSSRSYINNIRRQFFGRART